TDTVDPLGGSYFLESLTKEIEARATEYIEKIDAMGGAVAAIEAGWIQDEIHESAFRIQEAVESGQRPGIGGNTYAGADEAPPEIQRIDQAEVDAQRRRVGAWREARDGGAVSARLDAVRAAAQGTSNLLPPMKEALRSGATLGEVSDVLREVFGEYHPSR